MGFRRQLISLAGAAAALAGCNTTNPEAVQTVAQPKTPVAKTLTSFTHAKTCMDHLLRQYGKTNILLTSDGVPDQTGQVSAGTRDMLIKALDDMSRTSHAFRFVDIDHTGLSSVFWIQNQVNQSFSVPPFYIRGSISQVDRNVTSDSIGGSISLPVVSIGASKDQIGSIITIDLQVGDLVKRQVIPGVTTTNTITVISKGQGLSADGLINQGAVSISLDNYTEEGTHQAIRTLLDYSLIELMGKFTKVPYQRCLELDSTDPAVMAGNRADFDRLKPAERLQAVQRALIAAGEYPGPADGILNRRFRDALNIAKANRNLIPNGRIDFDIFNTLANEGFLVSGPTTEVAVAARPGAAATVGSAPVGPAGYDPVGLRLTPPAGALTVGDAVRFGVTVTQAADLYCYYGFQDNGRPVVARVFPNRFQRDARVRPGQTVQIPGPHSDFTIEMAAAGIQESVACVATAKPYDDRTKPPVLREGDLTPLATAQTIPAVVDMHLAADRQFSSVQVANFMAR